MGIFTYFQPALTYLKDVITIGSIILATIIGLKGLHAWREQLHGTQSYDLAKRILFSIYKLKNAINYFRGAFMSAAEIQIAVKESGLELTQSDPNFFIKSSEAAFKKRWSVVVEAFEKLEVEVIEAQALWGNEAKEKIMEVRKPVNQLYRALEIYLQEQYHPGMYFRAEKIREETTALMFNVGTDEKEDPFSSVLTSTINSIDDFIRPYLAK